ncbi:MAG: DUF4868 domain-containing protein [Gammaproteobacteria bacterium]
MPVPAFFANFDIAHADVSVWLFRKSRGADAGVVFTGHWIDTDEDLDAALKEAVATARDGVMEAEDYSLTATLEHGQSLTIEKAVTTAEQIVEKSAEELPNRKATNIPHIQNTDFYVVKLTEGDNVLHAVRRTDASWVSKKNFGLIKVIFADDQLGLNPNPDFHLSRHVDLFIAGDEIVILDKRNFEMVLSYKEAHVTDFQELQADVTFSGLLDDLTPLVAYIGTNKLRLRRVCAIREKGHYADAVFIQNLRARHAEAGLNLLFDAAGRLIATPETCPDIILALLNHRLYSRFTEQNYDVPNATQV